MAKQRGLKNFSVLVSHVLVPPAIEAIASAPTNRVDGFLAAGHVCSVMGTWQYAPLVEQFGVPIVVGVDRRRVRPDALTCVVGSS